MSFSDCWMCKIRQIGNCDNQQTAAVIVTIIIVINYLCTVTR